mmetsp:Transcript_3093/g.7314  ORF Transcript_3093/g.7314 Transcript_3093/m.7314 type:complete len:94 (+) Transcript_3093:1325-1606(+)
MRGVPLEIIHSNTFDEFNFRNLDTNFTEHYVTGINLKMLGRRQFLPRRLQLAVSFPGMIEGRDDCGEPMSQCFRRMQNFKARPMVLSAHWDID